MQDQLAAHGYVDREFSRLVSRRWVQPTIPVVLSPLEHVQEAVERQLEGNVSEFDVSPKRREIAFIVRGPIYVASTDSAPRGATFPIPAVILAAEHYNLLVRMLEQKSIPKLSLAVAAQFHDAEIPGKSSEIVMLGAHLDSWHASTGGVDNGAGVAIVMEAMRILKAIDIHLKRRVRVALWSRYYVDAHFASRPRATDPKIADIPNWLSWNLTWPIAKKSDYERLSVYFNVDNGSGRFRGVNETFKNWFQPLAIPISNRLITWQAAVILASFVYNAADADGTQRSAEETRSGFGRPSSTRHRPQGPARPIQTGFLENLGLNSMHLLGTS